MKPDDPPPGAPASPEASPPASLTNVRLRNRAQPETAAKPPVKRGDLTQQLQAADRPEPPAAEPARAPPKRGDLTQQLADAAAGKGAAPPVAPPPAPPPKAKAEPSLERKAAKAEPAPTPQPKVQPPAEAKVAAPAKTEPPAERKAARVKAEQPQAPPTVEPPLERKVAAAPPPPERKAPAVNAEPPRAPQPVERKPAAIKAEEAPLGQDEVDALFGDVTPPAAPEPPVQAKPTAAKAVKPPVAPVAIAAAPEPEAAAPAEPPADDTHVNIQAGSMLAEDDVRALLDPPGRRQASAAVPPPVAEPMAEPEELSAPEEEGPPPAEMPELRLVVDAPDETAEVAPEAAAEPEPAPAAAAASSVDQIIDYWDSLRGERPYPTLDTVDRSHISGSWPNCLLVAFTSMTGTDAVQPRMTRIGEANGQVEYTAMVIDWIIKCGRQSVKRGEPMEEEKRFPVTGGNARYQLLLLPISSTEGKADYVLAHLCRIKELSAGAAFKRWLAS